MSGFAVAGRGSDEIFGVEGRANTGSFSTPRARLNFIQGANVGIIVTEDVPTEEIRVTISASAPSAGLFGGVSNGFSSGAASGTFNIANQASVQLGFCFSAGSAAGAFNFVGFGAAKGTGSNQGHTTMNSTGVYDSTNGLVWRDGTTGSNGSVSGFGGTTFNIGFVNNASQSVGILASAIGWT